MRAIELIAGACLLLACGLFAYSAEHPVSVFELCTKIAALFSPTVTVAILTVPALYVAIRYLAPDRTWRSIVPMLIAGAIFMTPVVSGVTSWTLYFFCGITGALLMAKGLEPLCGDFVLSAARRLWDAIVGIEWRWFLLASVATHLTITVILCYWWFGVVPHVIDSVSQMFEARVISGGALTAPAPLIEKAFDCMHFVIRNGRWYSIYFPAHPFMIAIFLRLGIAYLAREIAGDRIARLTVLLALISPWWLLMHSELMNHATAGAARSVRSPVR